MDGVCDPLRAGGAAVIACAYLPAFPLQLLLLENPDWITFPMAVVDRDAPTGKVLWVNQRGWQQRIRPGMRYAAALSLASELRAGVVTPRTVDAATAAVVNALRDHSPSVESSEEQPGVFWLSATGLGRLHASLEAWADEVEETLTRAGYRATLVVGHERFAVSALALARHTVRVQPSLDAERRALRKVPLERIQLEPKLLEAMHRLGVRTLGQLMRLPRAKVSKRFGAAAERLYVQAHERGALPVQADIPREDVARTIDLGCVVRNADRLARRVQSVLPAMVGQLMQQDELLAELWMTMTLDRGPGEKVGGELVERVRPAQPTLDEGLILELVRLKLDATPLAKGVTVLALRVVSARADRVQPSLLEAKPKRDLRAAERALARLRAELGEEAVGTLQVADGHLPEARMRWVPLRTLKPAEPDRREVHPLIRRLSVPAIVLPPRPRSEPEGWLVRGPEDGAVVRSTGPQIVSGGWWNHEIHREYHFLETERGMLLWAFFDRRRRRWYLQGAIE